MRIHGSKSFEPVADVKKLVQLWITNMMVKSIQKALMQTINLVTIQANFLSKSSDYGEK